MGDAMGTPAYMPPEQALGEVEQMDERTDVFGLGVILAEILTGKPPYVAESGPEIFQMARRGKLKDCFTRLYSSGADTVLIALARAALELEHVDRIRNAGEVLEALTVYLESVQQRLRSSEIAVAKAQTRKRYSFAIAGLMLLFAIVGGLATASARKQSYAFAVLAENARAAETLADKKAEQALAAEQLASFERNRALQAEGQAITEVLRARMSNAESVVSEYPLVGLLLGIDATESFSRESELPVPSFAYETLLAIKSQFGRNALLHETLILDMEFSANGRWFASTDGSTVQFLDMSLENPLESVTRLDVEEFDITALEFSPNSRWLCGLSTSGSVLLWAVTGGIKPQAILKPESDAKNSSFAYSKDSSILVVAYLDGTAQVWELEASVGPAVPIVLASPDRIPLTSVAFGANNGWLLTGDERGNTYLWNLQDSRQPQSKYLIPENSRDLGEEVRHLFVNPDGRRFVSHQGGSIYVWEVERPSQPLHVLWGPYHRIDTCDISSDGRWLVTGGLEKTARLWDIESSDPMANYIELGRNSPIKSVDINDHAVVIGREDFTAEVYDIKSPADPPVNLRGHDDKVSAIALGPSRTWVATAGVVANSTLRFWELDLEVLLRNAKKRTSRELTPLERNRYMLKAKQIEGYFPQPLGKLKVIFDGVTLDGWEIEGAGGWRVENGELIGEGGMNVGGGRFV